MLRTARILFKSPDSLISLWTRITQLSTVVIKKTSNINAFDVKNVKILLLTKSLVLIWRELLSVTWILSNDPLHSDELRESISKSNKDKSIANYFDIRASNAPEVIKQETSSCMQDTYLGTRILHYEDGEPLLKLNIELLIE